MGVRAAVGLLAAGLTCAGACAGKAAPPPDAGRDDGRAVDRPGPGEAGAVLAVDFTVARCPAFEAEVPRCVGTAPLTVELVAIATAGVTKYLWDFGDGSTRSSERAPMHTYAIPGSYDVSLVGGGGGAGTASRTRAGFVVVRAGRAGAPCDVDLQCEGGSSCLCGSAARCTPAFPRGLCAGSCRDGPCPAGQVCVDFTRVAGAQSPSQPWQAPLCLGACAVTGDCAPGQRCRELPGRSAADSWVRGCFPDLPGDVGASCRGPSGQLRGDACTSGECVDLGAGGVCSLDCRQASCPTGATCVEMSDGRRLCLRACAPDFACDRDPLLGCVVENSGPFGFRVKAGPVGASYCAPRPCTSDDDCGIGRCRTDAEGGHCVRKAD